MPRPPDAFAMAEVLVQLRQDLVDEVKGAMKIANAEVLEQHRLLISRQEASLQGVMAQIGPLNGRASGLSRSLSPEQVPEQLELAAREADKMPFEQDENGQMIEVKEEQNEEIIQTIVEGSHRVSAVKVAPQKASRGSTWISENSQMARTKEAGPLLLQSGMCINIVSSHAFHGLSFFMIMANAIYIGVEADWNKSHSPIGADWGFQFCDQTFCTFFVVELICRFFTFRRKRDCFKDNWFLLDFIMVVLMVVETWIIGLVVFFTDDASMLESGIVGGMGRMLRLLRLTRISRLMKLIPELVTMVKGMIAAIRAVHAALIILILLVYVFAILMNAIMGPDSEYFPTVRAAMVTLLVQGVLLDDISGLTRYLIALGSAPALFCLAMFVLLSALTVMNMLIGVLCQVVLDVSAEEKENFVKAQMQTTLLVMLQNLDADKSGQLSKDEVQSVICEPEAVAIMMDIQVDTQHLLDLMEMLYVNEDSTLPISVIMNIVLSLRGKRPVTMNDLAKANNFQMWAVETQLAQHREMMTNIMHGSTAKQTQHTSKIDDLLLSIKEQQQVIKDHHETFAHHLSRPASKG